MREWLQDREHLVRLGALFVGGTIVFLIVRALLVPADFGVYGHFRAGALDDVRALPVHFAGRAACLDCHQDVAEAQSKNAHVKVGCESCHGAGAAHLDDPQAKPLPKLELPTLCVRCHMKDPAKPKGFPQIVVKDHYEGLCTDCHDPHAPQ